MASDAVDRFTQRAAELGVAVEAREFPEGTRTAVDAAAAIGCDVAQIVKSLVFVAGGEHVLVLTSGANRVDEALVASHLGAARLDKADANGAREATGYAIGGTPPFGHDTELRVVCDRDLLDHDEVWAAAGTPMHVFPLTPGALLATTGAEVIAVC